MNIPGESARRFFVWLCVLVSITRPLGAGQPLAPALPPPTDYALDAMGTLHGYLTDVNGKPVAHAMVKIIYDQNTIAASRTDSRGHFAISGLRNGIHHVKYRLNNGEETYTSCRLWTRGTEPPAADAQMVLRTGEPIVRGQHYPSEVWCCLTSPWVTAGLITAAIAIPLALIDEDDSSS